MIEKRSILTFLLLVIVVSCQFFADDAGRREKGEASSLLDVHGAGAQRSDPKTGDPADYPEGHGPQGDVIRIYNFVRPVRSLSGVSDPYPIVDTGQITFFDTHDDIGAPASGEAFFGQDAAYTGLEPGYRDNGDGTVTDLNTGLMWQQDPGEKMGWSEAQDTLKSFNLAGHTDWRLPSIKELYSLILFSGRDVSVAMKDSEFSKDPFIDAEVFQFSYGDGSSEERIIDSQYLSSTRYVSTTMEGDETVFGVNFADGRIKGYPLQDPKEGEKGFFVLYVRGSVSYGKNNFVDNGDGTVSDLATGLMWFKDDSTEGMDWPAALEWVESLEAAGYSDWRLPDAKELQSLVDYTRSPATTGSAAIAAEFNCTAITDEGDAVNYPFYWTSTTHADSHGNGGNAVYIAFGEALGFMSSGGGTAERPVSRETAAPQQRKSGKPSQSPKPPQRKR